MRSSPSKSTTHRSSTVALRVPLTMNDRLADINSGVEADLPLEAEDIEAGRDAGSNSALEAFNREADAIDKVYVWANHSITTIKASLSDAQALSSISPQLDAVDTKLDAVRKRLKRIANENKDLAASGAAPPSTMRIRVNRYTKLGTDFMEVVSDAKNVREEHKKRSTDSMKNEVLRANPQLTEEQVQSALDQNDSAQWAALMDTDNAQLRHQLEDLRSRNADLQTLTKNIVDLHQMFQDMSIVVETQQKLINEVEDGFEGVKIENRKANDELIEARQHQKAAGRKKMWITLIVIAIVIVIALIFVFVVFRNQIFGNGSSSDSSTSPAPTSPAPTSRLSSVLSFSSGVLTKSEVAT